MVGDLSCPASAGFWSSRLAVAAQLGEWGRGFLRGRPRPGFAPFLLEAGIHARPTIGVPIEVDRVNGGCLAMRRQTFHELGMAGQVVMSPEG